MAGENQPTGLAIGIRYTSLACRVLSNLENELLIVFFMKIVFLTKKQKDCVVVF